MTPKNVWSNICQWDSNEDTCITTIWYVMLKRVSKFISFLLHTSYCSYQDWQIAKLQCHSTSCDVLHLLLAESRHRQLLLGNGSTNTSMPRQWLSSCHMKASADTHVTTEEPWEAVFSVQSLTRLYREDELPLVVGRLVSWSVSRSIGQSE
jgi:hypothetical protein